MPDFNLPPAPEGHFWSITSMMGLPMLVLRKKVWFWSVYVDGSIPIGDQTPGERIEWAAQRILNDFYTKQQDEQFLSKHRGNPTEANTINQGDI